ncbi:hypothetical protein JCGZ_24478 [Jatropha curcas]|uniref:GRAM domain-containing protein n=1 Tax=Jatropha curcas TaxID=180498 RepID=A0A067L8N6_JATCU|nr:putative GEM-like protein 8 [Jatropha curcas]KDP40479.1 hypothetical protein JCGZ_24478 [Jatropha curcas]
MKNPFQDQVIGIPIKSVSRSPAVGYLPEPVDTQCRTSCSANGSNVAGKTDSMLKRINKLGKKADNFTNCVLEHVRLGPKITETLRGKLRLGAKILQVGGVERIFRQLFPFSEDEKLLKASQCYLSTTAGPIAGLLFISTHKVAFCSERSIKFSTPNGKSVRLYYKVLIPLRKIKSVNESENVKKPSQKYMEIVTVDNFEFWFMGFLNYQKALKYIQQAISHRS